MIITRRLRRTVELVGTLLFIVAGAAHGDPPASDTTVAEEGALLLRESGVRGGLVVHVPCGDGRLTAALRAGDGYVVQGLDRDQKRVQQARQYAQRQQLYGPVSIRQLRGNALPYADNLVNLLVIEPNARIAPEEQLRVLAPGGVIMQRSDRGWDKRAQPWPLTIDQWTHALHGPDNNAVANDTTVGPPKHFQWISQPRFSRSHDHLASVSAIVTARGRLFSIVDYGSIAFAGASPRWELIARDAFSGVRLWTRDIGNWEYHLRDFRSGPVDLDRRLVAVDDRVFVTLGLDQPVSVLDAATGETLRTIPETSGAQEILCERGKLFVVVGKRLLDWQAKQAEKIVEQPGYEPPFEKDTPPVGARRVIAVDVESGKVLWQNTKSFVRELMPTTLAVSEGRVYFQNTESVVCLNAESGRLQWQAARPVHRKRLAWSSPTLVVHSGVVFSADRRAATTEGELLWIPSGGYHDYIRGDDVQGEIVAFRADDGKPLWRGPAFEGFNAPVDVLLADGLVWSGRMAWGRDPGITQGLDPQTGEVRRQRPPDQKFMKVGGHARCFRTKATSKYLILGRRGVEFVDLDGGGIDASLWMRGMCQFGVLPANGLLYIPPHACACKVDDLLKVGFAAFAPESDTATQHDRAAMVPLDAAARLVPGPAYPTTEPRAEPAAPASAASNGEWPMYRHDPARSGATTEELPPNLHAVWKAKIGRRISPPVIAGNRVLVAESDRHRICALDATTGQPKWTFLAGARIDSAPSIRQERAIFGSSDGWVYCLRLRDGVLIWKFHAALQNRAFVVDEQLESTWPISGSVLVSDGSVYFVAGRTSHLEGGMGLFELDVTNGRLRNVLRLNDEDPTDNSNKGKGRSGYLPDLLSADDESLFLLSKRFDRKLVEREGVIPHLWSSAGFLDDTWWHRTYWQYGTSMSSGWGGWPKAGQRVPSGRLLVKTESQILGYGRNQYDIPGAHVGVDAQGVWGPIGAQQGRWTFYRLFGQRLAKTPSATAGNRAAAAPANRPDWTARIPVLAEAMVSAGGTLFVAGPVDPSIDIPRERAMVDRLAKAYDSTEGGKILAVSASDGKILTSSGLDSPPVFDGMAVARGRMYLSAKNGELVCLAPESSQ